MSFHATRGARHHPQGGRRVPEGEDIRHLNIMPMMDMMTILLVAFVFQAATSATEITAGTVSLSEIAERRRAARRAGDAHHHEEQHRGRGRSRSSASTTATSAATSSEGGCLGDKITKLTQFLANLHQQEVAKQQAASRRPGIPKPPELLIIADRTTPYRLLIEVMFSAKQPEAGYKHFRLIVQKSFPPSPPCIAPSSRRRVASIGFLGAAPTGVLVDSGGAIIVPCRRTSCPRGRRLGVLLPGLRGPRDARPRSRCARRCSTRSPACTACVLLAGRRLLLGALVLGRRRPVRRDHRASSAMWQARRASPSLRCSSAARTSARRCCCGATR